MADEQSAQAARGKAAKVVDDTHLVEAKVATYFPSGRRMTDAQNAAVSAFKSWTLWNLASWWATVSATPDFLLNASQTDDEADTKRSELDAYVSSMTAAGVFSGDFVETNPPEADANKYPAGLYERAAALDAAVKEIVPQLDADVGVELSRFNDTVQTDIAEGTVSEADAESALEALGSMIARAGLPAGGGGAGCGAAAIAILIFGANSV